MTTGRPAMARALAVDPANPPTLYAGTYIERVEAATFFCQQLHDFHEVFQKGNAAI